MIDCAQNETFSSRRMSMQPLRINVDIVMERVPLSNRWVSEAWRPFAVVPSADALVDTNASPHVIDASESRWSFPGLSLELHPTEAEGYFLNLTSPAPCVFVMWRMSEGETPPPVHPVLATVSYNEAGRLMDGGERVDTVALPAAIADWMRPFVATHYKPEPRTKVKRNPLAENEFVRDRRDGGTRR
jgi:uncharacterized protein DUF3305